MCNDLFYSICCNHIEIIKLGLHKELLTGISKSKTLK
jgi:hypothetical protein